MDTAGLLVERHRTDYIPPLLEVRSTRTVDRVTVRMLPGQRVEDYAGWRIGWRRRSGRWTAGFGRSGSVGIWSSSGS